MGPKWNWVRTWTLYLFIAWHSLMRYVGHRDRQFVYTEVSMRRIVGRE
jgi:hypothetical protein